MSKNKIYRRYRTRWLIPLRVYENSLYRKIYNVFNKESRYISSNYNNISINGFSIIRTLDLKKNIEKIVSSTVKEVITFSAKMVQKDIEREIKQDDFAFIDYITQYLGSDFFVESIEQIATTYFDDVRNIIDKGIREEMTRDDIAKEIQVKMPSISKYRSKTIAITETHRASSYASEKRAKDMANELGLVMLKDWIPVADSRTRSAHLAMASKPPIPLNEMFVVGGEKMSRPNDPRASAGNTIRCRCILRYIPDE